MRVLISVRERLDRDTIAANFLGNRAEDRKVETTRTSAIAVPAHRSTTQARLALLVWVSTMGPHRHLQLEIGCERRARARPDDLGREK